MYNKLDTIWYADSSMPTAFELAVQLGELQKDLRNQGIQLKKIDGASHENEDEPNLLSFNGNIASIKSLSEGGKGVVVGLSNLEQREFILVRANSIVQALDQLKGAKLGIPAGTSNTDIAAQAMAIKGFETALQSAGLTHSEVQWIQLWLPSINEGGVKKNHRQNTLAQRISQALLIGEVDAICVHGALGLDIQHILGAHILADSRHETPIAFSVSPNLLYQHANTLDRIIAHMMLALKWAIKHRIEANRIIAKHLSLAEELVEPAFSESLYYQFEFGITPDKIAAFNSQKNFLLEHDLLKRDYSIETCIDDTRIAFAQELIDAGEIAEPNLGSVSEYARFDVPLSYFTNRPPVRIIQTDEEAIEVAKAYAAEIKLSASDRDRNRKLPFEELKKFAELGLLGLVVPKAYGGPDVSTNTLIEVIKIISAADGSIGQIPQNHHFFVKVVELNGTEEQKSYFFNQVLQGAQFGNGLAERGNKAGEMSTRIVSVGSGKHRLTGKKYYCTGSLFSSWIPILAIDEQDKRVAVFVPRNAPGLTIIDDWSGIGQRTTASGSVILNDIEVLDNQIIPHWKTFEGPQYFHSFGQIMHAAIDIGIASAALEDAARFVREKTRPALQSRLSRAADEPYLIRRFGELGVGLLSSEALLEKAANSIDRARSDLNEHTAGHASLQVDAVKYLATDVVIEVTNALFEVSGTSSMDEQYNLDRHWRNGRIHTLHDPARWKLHHVGNWYLNDLFPPNPFAKIEPLMAALF
jgi:SfnB family sulfur acquisition oxidoreductase